MSVYDEDRCANLRWKGLYMYSPGAPPPEIESDHVYWCHKTLICLGPDGKGVDDYECCETRTCYKPL